MIQQPKAVKHVINPQANSRTVDRQVWRAERVFLWIAVLITSIGFFFWGGSVAAQYTDIWWIQTGVGLVLAIVSAFVTDFAFRSFLEEVVFQLISWFHPNVVGRAKHESWFFNTMTGIRWVLLFAVVVALFVADWISVQAIRDPFAAQAKQVQTTDLKAVSASLSAEFGNASAPMQKQIEALTGDIRAAENRTKNANPALVSLANNGNQWAANELEKKTRSATRAMRKDMDDLRGAYVEALRRQSATVMSATEMSAAKNAEIEAQNRQNRYTLSNMFFLFGAGCKALTVILRIFLVVSFLERTPKLDVNNDGVVDGKDVTDAARGGSFR